MKLTGEHNGELAFLYLAGYVTLLNTGPGRTLCGCGGLRRNPRVEEYWGGDRDAPFGSGLLSIGLSPGRSGFPDFRAERSGGAALILVRQADIDFPGYLVSSDRPKFHSESVIAIDRFLFPGCAFFPWRNNSR